MFHFEKVFLLIVLLETISCTIAGLTYMDQLHLPPSKSLDNPCNPLYWYPRPIPDYCYPRRNDIGPTSPKPVPVLPPGPVAPVPPPPMVPVPLPLPPMPMPMSMPMPMYMPMPGPPLLMPGPPLLMPGPPLPMPGPALPMPIAGPGYAIPPLQMPGRPGPIPSLQMPGRPGPSQPYPMTAAQIGLVPGVNGLVSPEGAINILPFSDVYSDLLEKHKQKIIRIRLQNLLDEYEYPRRGRRRSRCRKHDC